MEDSSKHEFRVGDRVTWGTRHTSYVIDYIDEGLARMKSNSGIRMCDGHSVIPFNEPHAFTNELELIKPAEPVTKPLVRTETRLVIDEGDYNGIRVEVASDYGDIAIGLVDEEDDSEVDMFGMTVDDMRKIAKTITELADALEAGAVVAG